MVLDGSQLNLRVADIASAEALGGAIHQMIYVDVTETMYRYVVSGAALTPDSKYILNTLDAGDTRLVGVSGKYALEPKELLKLDTTYVVSGTEALGQSFWNADKHCMSTVYEFGAVYDHGFELYKFGTDEGNNFPEGSPVSSKGVVGNKVAFELTDASSTSTNHHKYIGLITTAPDSGNRFVTREGDVNGIDTTGATLSFGGAESWNEGDILYVDPVNPGYMTNVMPDAPNNVIHVGEITIGHATEGQIALLRSVHERLTELADVNGTALTYTGQFPIWDQTNGFFDFTHDFLQKGDGTGLPNQSDTVITYNETTRVLSINPVGASFDYYIKGKKYTSTGLDFAAHAAVTGGYFLYIDSNNNPQVSTTPWTIIGNEVPVAYVYYNSVLGEAFVFNERHMSTRNLEAHLEFHEAIGTRYVSGLAASAYNLSPVTPVDADNQFSIAFGETRDEDIPNDIAGVAAAGPYYIFYRSGASGDWTWVTSTVPFPVGTYVQYNEDTGATWQLTDMAANKYINVYVIAIQEINGAKQTAVIIDQNQHDNLTEAQGSSFTEDISTGTFPFQEIALIHKFTLRTSAAYTSTGKCRVEAYEDLRGTTARQIVSGGASSQHNSLAGLQLAGLGVTYGHINDQAQIIAGVKTFSSFAITPSSAPTTDYQVANKKYVDDNISGPIISDATLAGAGTVASPLGIDLSNANSWTGLQTLTSPSAGNTDRTVLAINGIVNEPTTNPFALSIDYSVTDVDSTRDFGKISFKTNDTSENINTEFSISTYNNSSLSEKFVIEPNGTIISKVTGYENLVTSDNDIPNKKYVDDNATSPAGSNMEVQYNNSGSFGASSGFKYNAMAEGIELSGGAPTFSLTDASTTTAQFFMDGLGNLALNQFLTTPSSAPTTDYQVANKKYVDDNGGVATDSFSVKASGGDEAWSGSGPYTATRTAAEHGIGQTPAYALLIKCYESDGSTGYDEVIPSNININASGDVEITMPTNNDLYVYISG